MNKCPNCGNIVIPRIYPGGLPKKYCSPKCRWHSANIRHPRHQKKRHIPILSLIVLVLAFVLLFTNIQKTYILPIQEKTIVSTVLISCSISTPQPTPEPLMCASPPVYARKISERGLKFISFYEGFSNAEYNDNAPEHNCTIGFGRKLRDGPCQGNEWPTYITRDQALVLLQEDISKVDYQIYMANWNLSQTQWDAISSTLYNLGWPNFIKTPIYSTLQVGDLSKVPNAIKQTICCISGLISRRNAEANLFQNGIYPSS